MNDGKFEEMEIEKAITEGMKVFEEVTTSFKERQMQGLVLIAKRAGFDRPAQLLLGNPEEVMSMLTYVVYQVIKSAGFDQQFVLNKMAMMMTAMEQTEATLTKAMNEDGTLKTMMEGPSEN